MGTRHLAEILQCHDTGPAACAVSWTGSPENKVLRKRHPDPEAVEPAQN